MKSHKISNDEFNLLKRIAKKTGFTEFWLGGSITYLKTARKIGINFKISDYDLAVKIKNELPKNVLRRLKIKGFKIIESRSYYLKFKKVHQIVASKGSVRLDIAFVEQISDLGHFNWETIFWHYPSGQLLDSYNALATIKDKKLTPTIQPHQENPFILTARFLKLCARFDIDFWHNNIKLRDFSKKLALNLKSWSSRDAFHNRYAREHGYYGFFQAILRAKNRSATLSIISKSGILQAMFPEIGDKTIASTMSSKELKQAKSVSDLIKTFEKYFSESPGMLKSLRRHFKLLERRIQLKITKK